MTYSATYSPDDNKLRLYASSRLDSEAYARVKAAGFGWAPKQDLFVAPAWTPNREDLLIELAGEIGDEDTTLIDRAEERADRFEDYSDHRTRDAESASGSIRELLDGIPLGQPILVGHHSERRARKDAERIESAMRRAVTMWDRAEYWTDRAAGALRHAKHKERPDVRHRRIKTIEADLRKQERARDEATVKRSLWAQDGLTLFQALDIAGASHLCAKFPVAEYPRPEGASMYEGEMSFWSAMRDGLLGHEEAARRAIRVYDRSIEWAGRWIAHYENRLAYERAMLAESGGIAADRFEILPGGQVLVRGDWLTVRKLNVKAGATISVSTMARDYRRVVGIEEVKDYRPPTEESAAAVKKATTLPPLTNYPREGAIEMTRAQWERNGKDYQGTKTQPATAEVGAHRYRVLYQGARGTSPVFLTDAKRVEAPKAEGPEEPRPSFPIERAAPTTTYTPTLRPGEEVRDALKAGVQIAVAPQLFPTPPDLAARMVDLAEIEDGHRILEPSAGTGNLLRAIADTGRDVEVVAVELDGELARRITPDLAMIASHDDFLGKSRLWLGYYDRVLMNPPFANADDIRHIRHGLTMLKPGGRLVAICAGGPRQERELRPLASHWERLPEGTFKESGTNVSTVLLVIEGEKGA